MRRLLVTAFSLLLLACQYSFDLEMAPDGVDLIACTSHEYCDPQLCRGFVTGNDRCDRDGWYLYDDDKLIQGDTPGDQEGAYFVCAGRTIRYPHCVSSEEQFVCDGKECEPGQICGVRLDDSYTIRCVWPTTGTNAGCGTGDCGAGDVCVDMLEIDPNTGEPYRQTACVPEGSIGPP